MKSVNVSESAAIEAAALLTDMFKDFGIAVWDEAGNLKKKDELKNELLVKLFAVALTKPHKRLYMMPILDVKKRTVNVSETLIKMEDVLDLIADNNIEGYMSLECYDALIRGVYDMKPHIGAVKYAESVLKLCDQFFDDFLNDCKCCPIHSYSRAQRRSCFLPDNTMANIFQGYAEHYDDEENNRRKYPNEEF